MGRRQKQQQPHHQSSMESRDKQPTRIVTEEMHDRGSCLSEANEKFRKKAASMRSDHLNERLLLANKKGDTATTKAIQQIKANEKSKLEWARIKLAIGKPSAGAITKVL